MGLSKFIVTQLRNAPTTFSVQVDGIDFNLDYRVNTGSFGNGALVMEVLRFVDGRSMLISGALERKGFHHGVGRARGQRKSMEILPKTE